MQVLIVILAIVILVMIYSVIELRLLKITTYTIESERIGKGLDGKRIVLLSDLHNTEFGSNNEKLIKYITDCKPDYILIAGDLINGTASRKQFTYASQLLTKLGELNIPVYYAFGNHECRLKGYFYDSDDFKQYRELTGQLSTVLNNSSVDFGPQNKDITKTDGLLYSHSEGLAKIHGLMLPPSEFNRKPVLKLAKPVSDYLGEIDKSCYNILIAHDPSFFEDYMEWGADLVVSGHIHGGIARLPFLGGVLSPRFELFPKYDKGLYRNEDGKCMIVSGGIGWHGLPFRFLNRPEIVLLNMKSI